ncbi:MAG: PEP-CTERM sorting domain-containing protein [Planctomycetaceae bacterium]|nr:PEP-CTERM sorting domain-containing protein [Planctomycetaceae bacterium]
MKFAVLTLLFTVGGAATALAQTENPDYRIKAEFRDAADESVGNANFRVKSRFLQVYYGGVSRKDEFRFQIELSSPAFADQSFNVFVKDFLVGTLTADGAGFLDQNYRSDFKPDDAPEYQPLPDGFPDFIDAGDVVNVYDSVTNSLLLTSVFGEEFDRGDADMDGDVDDDDLLSWRSGYGGDGLGPANGDYSGDNLADGSDFLVWQRHRNGAAGSPVAAVPEPSTLAVSGMAIGALAWVRRRRVER